MTVYLDRPAILTNVRDRAHALVGVFGASDAALLDVLTGAARAEGTAAVRAALVDARGGGAGARAAS